MANDAAFVSLFCPQCGGGITSTDEVIICPYCGTRLLRRVSPPAGSPGAAETPGRPRLSMGMRFTPYTSTDSACGLEAFHLLIPSGWQVMGGVQWNFNNPAAPATVGFRVYNPGGPEAFEAFPNLGFFWTNEPMMRMYYPPGSMYNGSEVREPLNAQQFFRQIHLPRARPVSGLQIVTEEHLPDLVNQMHTYIPVNPRPPQMVADGGRVRVRYNRDGTDVEEDVYGVVELVRQTMPSMTVGVAEMDFWVSEYVFSYTARAGQLDTLFDLFQTMLTSFKIDQRWYVSMMQVSRGLVNNTIQQSNRTLELSRYIANNQNEISNMISQSYNYRQQVLDHTSQNFSQAIRGVENYFDPHLSNPVELPNGYQNAWTNNLGEYVVSNDANYDPNLGSNQSWTQMKKQG